jgi:hypothetical protein
MAKVRMCFVVRVFTSERDGDELGETVGRIAGAEAEQ